MSSTGERPRGPSAEPYQGMDRRGRGGSEEPLLSRAFLLAAILLLGAWLLVVLPLADEAAARALDVGALDALIEAAAAATAAAVALLALARWRLVGHAPGLLTGLAVGAYGLFVVGVGELLPRVVPGSGGSAQWVRLAGGVAVAVFVVRALRSPPVDATLRPARLFLLAAAPALAAGAAAAALLGPLPAPPPMGPAFSVGAVWVALAVVALRSGARQRDRAQLWAGLMLAAFALAEIAPHTRPSGLLLGIGGAAVLHALAVGFALAGANEQMGRAYTGQSQRLLHSVVTMKTAQALDRAEEEANRKRVHDAYNALTAIDGVTRTVERYRDTIDPDTRQALTASVSQEVLRLQRLLGSHGLDARAYTVEEAVRAPIAQAQDDGVALEADIPALQAYGHPEAVRQAVTLLLDSLGASTGLRVTAEARGDEVLIHFERPGPGASSPLQEAGVGLFVASRIAGDQGGSVRADEGAGRVTLFLPAGAKDSAFPGDRSATAPPGGAGEHALASSGRVHVSGDDPVEQRDELLDVGQADEFLGLPPAQDDRRGLAAVGEPDGHLRRHRVRKGA